MSDTNPERPDELNPETKERLEEQMNSGVSMKEIVEKGKIVILREED